jgi:hypothetical protein
MYSLDIITKCKAFQPVEVWNMLRASHPELLEDAVECSLDDEPCMAADVAELLTASEKPHFGISVGSGSIQYGHVNHHLHSLIWLDGLVGTMADAEAWIKPFLETKHFIQGWVYDAEYSRWQNAEDPLVYETAGRSLSGLPMKSNGLPFPLEQQVVDVSQNPGRRQLRHGYVEAVASTVWVSPKLIESLAVSEEQLTTETRFSIERSASGAVRIQISESPITEADTLDSEQDLLRSVLYGTETMTSAS